MYLVRKLILVSRVNVSFYKYPLCWLSILYANSNKMFLFIIKGLFCRITVQLSLEGASGGHLAQAQVQEGSHLELTAQDHVQVAFEYFQVNNLSGQPVPEFSHPPSKTAFPDV